MPFRIETHTLHGAARRTVLIIWVLFLVAFVVFSPVIFLGGLAFPFVMVNFMVPACALSVLLIGWWHPRIAAALLAATILETLIAWIALSRPGGTLTAFGRPVPLLPVSQTGGILAALAGGALPLVTAIWTIRRMRNATHVTTPTATRSAGGSC